jgi:chromosome segregation ATPase
MTRVYAYGTVPQRIAAVRGEEEAGQQLRLANRLWNTLVAIERTRMERYQLIMRDEVQEQIDAIRQRMDALREEIKTRRKAARKRAVNVDELTAALATARTEIGTLIDKQKATAAARHDAKRADLCVLSARLRWVASAKEPVSGWEADSPKAISQRNTSCQNVESRWRLMAGTDVGAISRSPPASDGWPV